MSTTQSTLKTVADEPADNQTDDDYEIRRSDVAQAIPLPGIEQVDDFAEWQELAAGSCRSFRPTI
jgi:hypothetical protein